MFARCFSPKLGAIRRPTPAAQHRLRPAASDRRGARGGRSTAFRDRDRHRTRRRRKMSTCPACHAANGSTRWSIQAGSYRAFSLRRSRSAADQAVCSCAAAPAQNAAWPPQQRLAIAAALALAPGWQAPRATGRCRSLPPRTRPCWHQAAAEKPCPAPPIATDRPGGRRSHSLWRRRPTAP